MLCEKKKLKLRLKSHWKNLKHNECKCFIRLKNLYFSLRVCMLINSVSMEAERQCCQLWDKENPSIFCKPIPCLCVLYIEVYLIVFLVHPTQYYTKWHLYKWTAVQRERNVRFNIETKNEWKRNLKWWRGGLKIY